MCGYNRFFRKQWATVKVLPTPTERFAALHEKWLATWQ